MRFEPMKSLAALALTATLALPTAADAVEVQELTSPAGQSFWLVSEPSIPIVALEMSFTTGARLDPDGREGLTRLVMGLLDEGAGERDAVAFSAEADALSARFGFSAGRDSVTVSARMLTETIEPASALLAEALSSPRFDADALERVRGQALSGIASDETDPGAISQRRWFSAAFAGHAYARPTSGTAESVGAITRDDLVAQHKRILTRSSALIGIVGNIDAAAAGALIDRVLAGLTAGEPVAFAPPETEIPPGQTVVDFDVPQSVVLFGHAGIAREDEDYIPAFVMNYILGGGGFSSRLMTEVREKRGLAYGVYAYIAGLDGAPLYLGRVQTANARVAESIAVIREEWARMAAEGVTEEELAKAKRYLTGAFPLRFDSNAKIARFLVGMQESGLGTGYIDERNGLIEAVTLEDIRRVAARVLQPDALSVVVVGKPEGL
ncbi:MAG: pitrilysin family protein [Pseudomonadota bacterium]